MTAHGIVEEIMPTEEAATSRHEDVFPPTFDENDMHPAYRKHGSQARQRGEMGYIDGQRGRRGSLGMI